MTHVTDAGHIVALDQAASPGNEQLAQSVLMLRGWALWFLRQLADHTDQAITIGVDLPELFRACDSDAHATGHLAYLRYGTGTAQRGWLTPDDIINTWPLDRLTKFLEKQG